MANVPIEQIDTPTHSILKALRFSRILDEVRIPRSSATGFATFGSRTVPHSKSASSGPGTAPAKNAARHPQWSTIQPPTELAAMNPSPPATTTIEIAVARLRFSKVSDTSACIVGLPPASPRPTPSLASSSMGKLVAAPHKAVINDQNAREMLSVFTRRPLSENRAIGTAITE